MHLTNFYAAMLLATPFLSVYGKSSSMTTITTTATAVAACSYTPVPSPAKSSHCGVHGYLKTGTYNPKPFKVANLDACRDACLAKPGTSTAVVETVGCLSFLFNATDSTCALSPVSLEDQGLAGLNNAAYSSNTLYNRKCFALTVPTLADPDFAQGFSTTTPWQVSGLDGTSNASIAKSPNTYKPAKTAAELYCSTENNGYGPDGYSRVNVDQYIATCPGVTYTMSYYYMLDGGYDYQYDTNTYMGAYDGVGTSVGFSGGNPDSLGNAIGSYHPGLALTFTANETSTLVGFSLICGEGTEQKYYVDTVSIAVAS